MVPDHRRHPRCRRRGGIPGENDREQIEGADPEHQELVTFVTVWAELHGNGPVTAGQLVETVKLHGLLETVLDLECPDSEWC